jgi:hypothetical protein
MQTDQRFVQVVFPRYSRSPTETVSNFLIEVP